MFVLIAPILCFFSETVQFTSKSTQTGLTHCDGTFNNRILQFIIPSFSNFNFKKIEIKLQELVFGNKNQKKNQNLSYPPSP